MDKIEYNNHDEQSETNNTQDLPPEPKKKKKSKIKHISKWKHSDMPVIDDISNEIFLFLF